MHLHLPVSCKPNLTAIANVLRLLWSWKRNDWNVRKPKGVRVEVVQTINVLRNEVYVVKF
jgi:hypothetical protein